MMPQVESSIVQPSRTTGSVAWPDRAALSGRRVHRVACTAEAVGFGPVSKLLSIAQALRDRERIVLDFFGHALACEAASRSGDLFDRFRQLVGNRPEEYTDLLDQADMVLSVMEPQPAIEGAARGLPVGYVDSLPFVWEPVLSPTQQRAIAASVVKGSDEARRACRDLTVHDLQAVAHRVASHSFLQVEVVHGWGMTEMSPGGTCSGWVPATLPAEERWRAKLKQGRPIWGVETRIVDAEGHDLPWDGVRFGELLVRVPNVARGYFADDAATRDAFSEDRGTAPCLLQRDPGQPDLEPHVPRRRGHRPMLIRAVESAMTAWMAGIIAASFIRTRGKPAAGSAGASRA
jgi:acyl-CoA synthetase (AMP-forming)/AMP-acid ligase II